MKKAYQKLKLKMQNDKAKFKKDFQDRLIKFSLAIIELCDEVGRKRKYWPILIKESMHSDRVNDLLTEVDEIANIVGSSILTLKGKRNF